MLIPLISIAHIMALSTKRDLKFLKKSDTSNDQNTSSTVGLI